MIRWADEPMVRSADRRIYSRRESRYIPLMADPYICSLCDKEEKDCKCDRYCCLCQGANDVRLCQDGQYYCLDCREACDFAAQY